MDYNKQTITVKYADRDITVQCPYGTIKLTNNNIFVLDYNKLVDEVGKQLEREMRRK